MGGGRKRGSMERGEEGESKIVDVLGGVVVRQAGRDRVELREHKPPSQLRQADRGAAPLGSR